MYVDYYFWLLEHNDYDMIKTFAIIFSQCVIIAIIGFLLGLIKLKKEEF